MACWTTGNFLERCKNTPLEEEHVIGDLYVTKPFGQGFRRTYVPHQGFKHGWPVTVDACALLNFSREKTGSHRGDTTYVEENMPDLQKDCEKLPAARYKQCKPLAAFGYSTVSGLTNISGSRQSVVQFRTNCVYEPYSKPQTFDMTLSSYFMDRKEVCDYAGTGTCRQPTPTATYKFTNTPVAAAPSTTTTPVNWSTQPGTRSGLVLAWPGILQGINEEWIKLTRRPNFILSVPLDNLEATPDYPNLQGGSTLVAMELSQSKTCPAFGNKQILQTNFQTCKNDKVAECTYAADTIAGGCEDKACVVRGFNTFMGQVRDIIDPQKTVLDPVGQLDRNKGLARLVEGLTEKGKCGEADFTCLKKLGTDCSFIAEAASKIQPQSQQMYEVLVRAQRVCEAQL
jgi:hypothetical protein